MNSWMEQAETHWKEFQPKRYAALKAKGQQALVRALSQAARRTGNEIDSLMEAGMTHEEAWEMTREEYLFPAPEPEVTAALEREA